MTGWGYQGRRENVVEKSNLMQEMALPLNRRERKKSMTGRRQEKNDLGDRGSSSSKAVRPTGEKGGADKIKGIGNCGIGGQRLPAEKTYR